MLNSLNIYGVHSLWRNTILEPSYCLSVGKNLRLDIFFPILNIFLFQKTIYILHKDLSKSLKSYDYV